MLSDQVGEDIFYSTDVYKSSITAQPIPGLRAVFSSNAWVILSVIITSQPTAFHLVLKPELSLCFMFQCFTFFLNWKMNQCPSNKSRVQKKAKCELVIFFLHLANKLIFLHKGHTLNKQIYSKVLCKMTFIRHGGSPL